MISIIQNLRIGTKLAITSSLTMLLVATMIYLQIAGGTDVHKATEDMVRLQTMARESGEAKASVRGMQVGTRDIAMSMTTADLQKAVDYFAERQASANKYAAAIGKLSKTADN